ncbi:unnamed protein product [Euphydryas editha]|uniref:Uncharacterized protein n=1 Tax=Euphydryas editha TaxID=104508 RepID=A0AAU9TR63_EUPED|nr:unnamed protein product [Euphydryas editha]
MRHRVCVVRWPLRRFDRRLGTSSHVNQTTESTDIGNLPSRSQSYCAHGQRARSTHAVASVLESLNPVKSWEEVPGPKPLPLLGNTWRFIPYIEVSAVPTDDELVNEFIPYTY